MKCAAAVMPRALETSARWCRAGTPPGGRGRETSAPRRDEVDVARRPPVRLGHCKPRLLRGEPRPVGRVAVPALRPDHDRRGAAARAVRQAVGRDEHEAGCLRVRRGRGERLVEDDRPRVPERASDAREGGAPVGRGRRQVECRASAAADAYAAAAWRAGGRPVAPGPAALRAASRRSAPMRPLPPCRRCREGSPSPALAGGRPSPRASRARGRRRRPRRAGAVAVPGLRDGHRRDGVRDELARSQVGEHADHADDRRDHCHLDQHRAPQARECAASSERFTQPTPSSGRKSAVLMMSARP